MPKRLSQQDRHLQRLGRQQQSHYLQRLALSNISLFEQLPPSYLAALIHSSNPSGEPLASHSFHRANRSSQLYKRLTARCRLSDRFSESSVNSVDPSSAGRAPVDRFTKTFKSAEDVISLSTDSNFFSALPTNPADHSSPIDQASKTSESIEHLPRSMISPSLGSNFSTALPTLLLPRTPARRVLNRSTTLPASFFSEEIPQKSQFFPSSLPFELLSSNPNRPSHRSGVSGHNINIDSEQLTSKAISNLSRQLSLLEAKLHRLGRRFDRFLDFALEDQPSLCRVKSSDTETTSYEPPSHSDTGSFLWHDLWEKAEEHKRARLALQGSCFAGSEPISEPLNLDFVADSPTANSSGRKLSESSTICLLNFMSLQTQS